MRVISRFNVERTLGFFEELGIMAKSKNGYIWRCTHSVYRVEGGAGYRVRRQRIPFGGGIRPPDYHPIAGIGAALL